MVKPDGTIVTAGEAPAEPATPAPARGAGAGGRRSASVRAHPAAARADEGGERRRRADDERCSDPGRPAGAACSTRYRRGDATASGRHGTRRRAARADGRGAAEPRTCRTAGPGSRRGAGSGPCPAGRRSGGADRDGSRRPHGPARSSSAAPARASNAPVDLLSQRAPARQPAPAQPAAAQPAPAPTLPEAAISCSSARRRAGTRRSRPTPACSSASLPCSAACSRKSRRPISARRASYYRVRVGPWATRAEAIAGLRDS